MPEWTLITHHGLVLVYLFRHPHSTAREIASAIGITEWTVRKLIADLEKAGYIERRKTGRNNVYRINPNTGLRHQTLRHVQVMDLLRLLGHEPGQTTATEQAAPDG